MPRFQRGEGFYSFETRQPPRRYVVRKDEDNKWVAESYRIEGGREAGLRAKFSDIPHKRDASQLVEFWMAKGI